MHHSEERRKELVEQTAFVTESNVYASHVQIRIGLIEREPMLCLQFHRITNPERAVSRAGPGR